MHKCKLVAVLIAIYEIRRQIKKEVTLLKSLSKWEFLCTTIPLYTKYIYALYCSRY